MNKKLLAAKIVAEREKLNMSQEELSKISGVSVRTISRYENAETNTPRMDSIELIAKALNVSPIYLLENLYTSNDIIMWGTIILSLFAVGTEVLLLSDKMLVSIIGVFLTLAALLLTYYLVLF